MKKAIRCCISCILPCGSLDVIRIVHANGRVEEISGSIRACEVMKAYPKHVLKKPISSCSNEFENTTCDDKKPRIVILPPDAELKRGKIYFLMPAPVPPLHTKKRRGRGAVGGRLEAVVREINHNNKDQMIERSSTGSDPTVETTYKHEKGKQRSSNSTMTVSLLSSSMSSSDQYLSELLSEEKLSTQREKRRGRVGVWRPRLESICE